MFRGAEGGVEGSGGCDGCGGVGVRCVYSEIVGLD